MIARHRIRERNGIRLGSEVELVRGHPLRDIGYRFVTVQRFLEDGRVCIRVKGRQGAARAQFVAFEHLIKLGSQP